MDKSILFHAKYTIAVVKFILHQGQIHGFFALCMMFRSLQFASAHSLRFASPRISLAVCTQPKFSGSNRMRCYVLPLLEGVAGKNVNKVTSPFRFLIGC